MNITITPTLLTGTVTPPPSKSQAHRLIIAAALAPGESVIENIVLSEDMKATLRCIENLGARWRCEGSVLTIQGMAEAPDTALPLFDCGESGSTLRFFIPIALAVCGGGRFTGRGRLMQRPQQPYFDLFAEKGIFYEQTDGLLTVKGRLAPGRYALRGDISSQFFTGLLYALSLLPGESEIISTTALESRDYVAMTIEAQRIAGVTVKSEALRFICPGGAVYRPFIHRVEADWSQAGFWYAAAACGNPLTIAGLNPDSAQGDRVIRDFITEMASLGEKTFDVSGCPDLVPPLAAAAALRPAGEVTRITGAARLRIKESDRLATVHAALACMGAIITEEPEALTITGSGELPGGCTVDAANDHRIAMMTAIAATKALNPVTVNGAECVAKSYPDFWADYTALGGRIRQEG